MIDYNATSFLQNKINIEANSKGGGYSGVYKVPYPPPWGSLSSLLGKNIKLCREEGNIMAWGKNVNWKKRKREAISSSLDSIKAVGKNIK